MADNVTFDEILADPAYKAEFDRRITKALATVQRKLDVEVEKNKQLMETSKTEDGETVETLRTKLAELQKKYDDDAATHKTELETLKTQLADRDYSDAISRAISGANEGKGLKFSSKAARTAFEAAIREKKLELKDGVLTGFDDFVKAQKEADPDAFASDKPPAKFAGVIGVGGKPDDTPENVRTAKAMGAAKAQALKASNDVFSQYT